MKLGVSRLLRIERTFTRLKNRKLHKEEIKRYEQRWMGVEIEITERPDLRNIFGSSAHRFIACSTHCISVNHRPARLTLLGKL